MTEIVTGRLRTIAFKPIWSTKLRSSVHDVSYYENKVIVHPATVKGNVVKADPRMFFST